MEAESRIISLISDGETELFTDLVEKYQKPVYRLAYSILGNTADAEDAAQETFIRVYKSLKSYNHYGTFWAWLRKITVNICLKYLGKSANITSFDDTCQLESDHKSVFNTVIEKLEDFELKDYINQLPPRYRGVIVLKYLEDMSYAEIAETLGDSISNIQVNIFRAKKMLRERMRQKQYEML